MDWKFTHAADAAAKIAVQNALFLRTKRLSSLVMPWCTYTDPEVAHVGLSERDAAERGHRGRHLPRAARAGEPRRDSTARRRAS